MTAFPSLPLFVDAYLADAAHLTDAEHGRYLLLLMAMWTAPNCRIPNDDAWLARKFRRSVAEVRDQFRPLIREFCQNTGNWITQKRLSTEWDWCRDKGEKRSVSAKPLILNRPKSKKTTLSKNHSGSDPDKSLKTKDKKSAPIPIKKEGGDRGDAGAREATVTDPAIALATELLAIAGMDPEGPGAIGAAYTLQSWLNHGWVPETILLSVRKQARAKRDGPPHSLNYFAKGIAREHALAAQPIPTANVVSIKPEIVHVQRRENVWNAAGERLLAEYDRRLEEDAPGNAGADGGSEVRDPTRDGDVEILPPRRRG